jgi:hypothetical protein
MSVIDAKKQSLVNPSSNLLDMHLAELEEECTRFLSLIVVLRLMAEKSEAADEDERATIEGELYASLSHLNNHARPAMEEMDRIVDEMPDDEEDNWTKQS